MVDRSVNYTTNSHVDSVLEAEEEVASFAPFFLTTHSK